MHHNPHATSEPSGTPDQAPAPAPAFALPGHRVIALSGRDAVAFAQAQCMNDVESAPVGRWQWNGWLTPKGRVIALFALVRVASDTLWLVVPDADAQALAAQLQRFVLRRQLTVAVRDDLHASGRFEAPVRAAGAIFDGDAATGIELDLGGFGIPRTLRIAPEAAERDAACEMQWTASDLRVGFPRLPPSQAEQWTPQMLSLERLNAYSVKKGCYPGQEIVARTHFLGKVKRGLALIEGSEAMRAGDDLLAGGQPLGHLVASADDGERHLALAVVPLEREPVALQAGAIEVREVPLGEGLAR
jgi:folate-binding protein YgfZ